MMGCSACSLSVAFGNYYKYTGKERDTESGLDMFGARYYGSSLGRFMTPDWATKPTAVPYAHYGNPQSLNLYSYVQNNPTTTGDPDGHCPSDDACSKVTVTVTKDAEPHAMYNQGLGPKGESGPYATGVGTTTNHKVHRQQGAYGGTEREGNPDNKGRPHWKKRSGQGKSRACDNHSGRDDA